MLNLNRVNIFVFDLSVFKVNNPDCIVNCLNINRVTIRRAKCLAKVTLKVLLASLFSYNSDEKGAKFPTPKNRVDPVSLCRARASSITKCLQGFQKMTCF